MARIGGGGVRDMGFVSLIIGEVRGGAGAKEAMRHASDSRTFHVGGGGTRMAK